MPRPEMHPLEWDDDLIDRFWAFASQSPAYANEYFAKQVGVGLTTFLLQLDAHPGRILDVGCGLGYLAAEIIRRGLECSGCDGSARSIEAANARVPAGPLWKGAQLIEGGNLPYADGMFDTVIASQTIEHVLPQQIGHLFAELRRVLRPTTGRLLLTTPNNEDLQ